MGSAYGGEWQPKKSRYSFSYPRPWGGFGKRVINNEKWQEEIPLPLRLSIIRWALHNKTYRTNQTNLDSLEINFSDLIKS
jgi:hypothetical protein